MTKGKHGRVNAKINYDGVASTSGETDRKPSPPFYQPSVMVFLEGYIQNVLLESHTLSYSNYALENLPLN